MRQPGMKDECFRLAKRIHHAVQEADEECGVEEFIEPDASSRTTSRSGFILRRRQASSINVPPCETLR